VARAVKLRLEGERCVGHGRCYELGPDVFGEDERGRCRLLREDVPAELQEQARLGAANCPERAIEIESD
jgi:ferredoxin